MLDRGSARWVTVNNVVEVGCAKYDAGDVDRMMAVRITNLRPVVSAETPHKI